MSKHKRSRSSARVAATVGIAAFLLEVGLPAARVAAAEQGKQVNTGVTQTIGSATPVVSAAAPLHLSDVQKSRIAEVLKTQDTEIEFKLKKTKSAKSFEPKIDEKLPTGLKGQAFPQPLITEMPPIRQYTYLKLKGQVLIVNPMTHKIVDMFPEQSG